MSIAPGRPSLGAPSTLDSSDLFLPQGAVGVFTLPANWAVAQHDKAVKAKQPTAAPTIDTETWIIMDLMDCGNLAQAIRAGAFMRPNKAATSLITLSMAPLLRRAADIAAGVAYLHSRSVCHGDLKCENILLKSDPQDPDGVLAKVADFGLSRALAFGQSHLSTRRYGTVTMMPPELLVSGKLTPAADVYSFGIMMWQFVTGEIPFHGLHHGEVIHRVVTQDLRPGPWPLLASSPQDVQAAAVAASQAAAGPVIVNDVTPSVWLHPDYIPLATSCWSRHAADRPSMPEVLDKILQMLADVISIKGDC
eukprot:gene12531-12664_t